MKNNNLNKTKNINENAKNNEKNIKVINKKTSFSASKAAFAAFVIIAGGAFIYSNVIDNIDNSEVLAPADITTSAPSSEIFANTSSLPKLTSISVTSLSETETSETVSDTTENTLVSESTSTDVSNDSQISDTEIITDYTTEQISATTAPPSYEKYIETMISDKEQYLIIMKNGISFEISDNSAEIVAYDESKNSQKFSLEIPETINGHPVTKISENVFQYAEMIEEVIFPSTVKEIGNYAFSGCKNLKTVVFSNCEAEIGRNAFYQSGVENVDFRNSILTMKTSAFRNTQVRELTITKDITFSGGMVFAECENLTRVVINDDAEFKQVFKGSSEFINCSGLSEVIYANTDDEDFDITQFSFTPFHEGKTETTTQISE